jgi:glutamyl-Q tRNA(Asp) synthetase
VSRSYTGRFAPSPTGELHLGSLFAAVASFLDARYHGGRWLLRMEDLDQPRVVPGAADSILRTLERFALRWDGAVLYQSQRTELYADALERLTRERRTFECSCSRRDMALQDDEGYPGTCRDGPARPGATATRFRVDGGREVSFDDRIQGVVRNDLRTLGDVVVRRRDGLYAYQLAVVVDDAAQGVTDVVRGGDLLRSTAWQIELQDALQLTHPRYAHVPLLLERDGQKLSKSRRSLPLDPAGASGALLYTLGLLGIPAPADMRADTPERLLDWAVFRWNPDRIRGQVSIRVAPEVKCLGVTRPLD